MRRVKIAIVGAGSAGLSARREVVKLTEDYVVIDDGPLGTTCARVGCMPSKVFIQVAQDFERRHKLGQEGINGSDQLSIDSRKTMLHVRALRDRFVRGVTQDMQDWQDTKLIRKRAKFIDPHILDLGDEKIYAEKIIIATGSRPVIPEVFKGLEKYIVTTDEFFEMKSLPKSALVVGLGVIGMEIGQALHRLGCETLCVARRKSMLGITDPNLLDYVAKKFEEEMNLDFSGIKTMKDRGDTVFIETNQGKTANVEKILMTAGRVANFKGLGLENIISNFNQFPKIDLQTFKMENFEHIYVVGDSTSDREILHEASDEGRIAGHNSAHSSEIIFQRRAPLLIAFTDPNIAFVGKSYKELEEEEIPFEIGQVLFEGQGRSIVKLKEIGMLRLYAHRETGKFLGCELFAPDGEHLGHLLSWSLQMGLTVNQMLSMPFYHPVVQEGLRTALRDVRGKVKEKSPPLEIYPIT